ncbi:MAG TPA: hypothetical protein VFG07_03185 [Thermoplasmata archaeon]|nr:hypothetical protein [Thermoplasmata archaeon]
MSLGRDAVVADVDPLACLLTRAKCTPVDPGRLVSSIETLFEVVGRSGYRADVGITPTEAIAELEQSTPYRAPTNVFHWFHPTIARDMARLLLALWDYRTRLEPPLFDAVLAVIAASIRRVSRADPKPVSGLEVTSVRLRKLSLGLRFDLQREVLARAALLGEGYSQLLNIPSLGGVQVSRSNAKDWARVCKSNGWLPTVQVTSPPYLKAIDYPRRHKLEYSWLGLINRDQIRVRSHEFLGVDVIRDRDFLKGDLSLPDPAMNCCKRVSQASTERAGLVVEQYFADLRDWMGEVSRVAGEADGVAYVVVGPSSVAGVAVDTPAILPQLASDLGLTLTKSRWHRVVNHRMQYTLRTGGRIDKEAVLCFKPDN